jgi:hypothetical protein
MIRGLLQYQDNASFLSCERLFREEGIQKKQKKKKKEKGVDRRLCQVRGLV